MSIILTNLRNAVITGIVLIVIMAVTVTYPPRRDVFADYEWSAFFIRWLHPEQSCGSACCGI